MPLEDKTPATKAAVCIPDRSVLDDYEYGFNQAGAGCQVFNTGEHWRIS